MKEKIDTQKGILALSPLIVFVALYLSLSIACGDFYKVPITVAFMLSSIYAIAIMPRGMRLPERIEVFSEGAADKGLLMMVWIFILAGAFAASARSMGAVQATVDLCITLLPAKLLITGLFLASCFISLSVGTSVGTIVALVPIASGIATQTGMSLAFVVGAVMGGAYFGDNLSFISDTTIVATRSQGCRLSDKFKANVRIVLPAAIACTILYTILGNGLETQPDTSSIQWFLVVPYILVFALAIAGIDVMIVLLAGLASTGIIGLGFGYYQDGLYGWLSSMGEGILGMSELIIVTLLASGMVGIIRKLGGINFLLRILTHRVSGKRGAEFSMSALVILTDFCTANNTIAILSVGSLAKEMSHKFQIDPRRAASILDTCSCFAQGIIPYGAQMLMASALAMLNPVDIIPYLYYPFLMMGCVVLAIVFRYPKKYS